MILRMYGLNLAHDLFLKMILPKRPHVDRVFFCHVVLNISPLQWTQELQAEVLDYYYC